MHCGFAGTARLCAGAETAMDVAVGCRVAVRRLPVVRAITVARDVKAGRLRVSGPWRVGCWGPGWGP